MYQEAIDYLYYQLPAYARMRGPLPKIDLSKTQALCDALGNPEAKLRAIHVAGTNGKGSVSHILSSLLQAQGLKVGLYTSPHLTDYCERIRVNGVPCSQQAVSAWVMQHRELMDRIQPSFFEATVAFTYDHLVSQAVDIAVIETGLGGRLDSTNVLHSDLQVITSIAYDHQDVLGHTLELIAAEKAGIIKTGCTAVLASGIASSPRSVIESIAASKSVTVYQSSELVSEVDLDSGRYMLSMEPGKSQLTGATDLRGPYQAENVQTALAAYIAYTHLQGVSVEADVITQGLSSVYTSTGLAGRWQLLATEPELRIDGAHNAQAFGHVLDYLNSQKGRKIFLILGFSIQKDVASLLQDLPPDCEVIFSQAEIARAIDTEELLKISREMGWHARAIKDPYEAYQAVRREASTDDLIFITGSLYLIGSFLESYQDQDARVADS